MGTYILKSVVFLAVFLGAYYLLLSRERMYRFNRFYLLSSLVLSLVLPLITIPIYVEAEAEPIQQLPIETSNLVTSLPVAVAQPVAPQPDYWAYAAIAGYILVVTVLAIRFAINIARFYRVKKNNTVSEYKGATLVLLKEDALPHTFMDNIFIGENEYGRRLVEPELLTHELAHVRQKHTLDVLFTELLKTVFWFNPLLYLYKKAIQTNHEFLADEAVINQHLNIPTYQLLLLDKATPPLAYALASSINFSLTKKRFAMMTKSTTKGKKTLLQAMMLPVIALTTTLLCHEVIAQQPETIATQEPKNASAPDRDEYYSGVRVIIEDKAKGISIDKKYEELTLAEKNRYMFDAPPKRTKNSPTAKEYEKLKDAKKYALWIDGVHVNNNILYNYKPEDFSLYTGSFVHKNARSVEVPQEYQFSLYTDAYYEKNFKKYHYPADVFRMNVGKEYKDGKVIAGKDTAIENKVDKGGEYKWPPSDKIKSINVYKNSEAQNDSLKKARPDLFKIPGTKYGRILITYEDDKGELQRVNLFVDQKEGSYNEENGSMNIKAVVPSQSHAVEVKEVQGYEIKVYNGSEIDEQPEFPGGLEEFYRLVKNEFKVPDTKKDSVLRIYISFVVEMDGSMSNFKIQREPTLGMGDEAIRVMKTITPKWKPGKKDGETVRALYHLPITINTKV